jgi:ABC-type amino acid transport substrate-binding protein
MVKNIQRLILATLIASHISIVHAQKIVLGGASTYAIPPYSWIDPCSGKHTGFTRDVIESVFSRLGIAWQASEPIAFSADYWPRLIEKLQQRELDGIYATYKMPDLDFLIYSKEPLVNMVDVIYSSTHVLDDNLDIRTLRDKKILVERSGQLSPLILQLKSQGFTFQYIDGFEEVIRALLDGKGDYLIANKYVSSIYAQRINVTHLLQRTEMNNYSREMYLALHKDSPAASRMPEIDRQLKAMKESGQFDFIRQRYMNLWISRRHCAELQSPQGSVLKN